MYYFIVNEASGRGFARKAWQEMKRDMSRADVPFAAWTTRGAGDATALARAASALPGEEIKLIVVGGDGTINEVLNGITDFDRVALGVIPMGSGNDFARGLRLPRHPRQAMARIHHSTGNRRIDLGRVQIDGHAPRLFGISSGVGLDARVCYEVDHSQEKTLLNHLGLGSLAYGIKTLSVVATMDAAAGTVRFYSGKGMRECDFERLLFLSTMNFPWEGGGVPIAPTASGEDGAFTVCMASGYERVQAFTKLPLLALGRHRHLAGVEYLNARRVELDLEAPLMVHADGEVPGAGRHIVFDILPKKLRILM